ncbi:MAG: M17 family peptidase N-terminal domain-containing protein, partial [Pseudomonadota bacterium]
MEFSIKSFRPGQAKSGCVVVGIFEGGKLSDAAKELDRTAKGYLTHIVRRGDINGKSGASVLLHNVAGVKAERVLLIGLGPQSEFSVRPYREALAAALRTINLTGAKDAELHLTALAVEGRDARFLVQQAVTVAQETAYRFDAMKSRKDSSSPALRHLTLVVDKTDVRAAEIAAKQAIAVARGMALTKDLGNLPPNVCTPGYLATQARDLAKRYRMKVQVLERDDMAKLGMGTLLAVALGSAEPPKFIVLEH